MSLLGVADLSISFAGLKALSRVSLEVGANEILGLIGPNGAGKTTLLNCLSRLYTPESGRVVFDGQDLLKVPVHGVAALGISRSFQNLELFADMTVLDNVVISCMRRYRSPLLAELLALTSARRKQDAARAEALAVLTDLGLGAYAEQRVGNLAFGTQKNIELARALAARPRLLLLDEPAAGLNPEESRQLGAAIRAIRRERGIAILLIEHDMSLVMQTCDRIVVLDHGEVISEGTPEYVQRDPQVMTAYLGTELDA